MNSHDRIICVTTRYLVLILCATLHRHLLLSRRPRRFPCTVFNTDDSVFGLKDEQFFYYFKISKEELVL